jgi:hypothetical protein
MLIIHLNTHIKLILDVPSFIPSSCSPAAAGAAASAGRQQQQHAITRNLIVNGFAKIINLAKRANGVVVHRAVRSLLCAAGAILRAPLKCYCFKQK